MGATSSASGPLSCSSSRKTTSMDGSQARSDFLRSEGWRARSRSRRARRARPSARRERSPRGQRPGSERRLVLKRVLAVADISGGFDVREDVRSAERVDRLLRIAHVDRRRLRRRSRGRFRTEPSRCPGTRRPVPTDRPSRSHRRWSCDPQASDPSALGSSGANTVVSRSSKVSTAVSSRRRRAASRANSMKRILTSNIAYSSIGKSASCAAFRSAQASKKSCLRLFEILVHLQAALRERGRQAGG